MPYITYKPNGRFGNNMLQYMTCKLLSLLSGNVYTYINYFEFPKEFVTFKEEDYTKLIAEGFTGLPNNNILCDGYFQKSTLLAKHRDYFLECMKSDDMFVERKSDFTGVSLENSVLYPVSSIFVESSRQFLPTDVVISIRLGDFIQYPCKTSDIVPPSFYFNMLKKVKFTRLYIVCDKPEKDWEKSYLALFDTYKAIRIHGAHLEDFATLRAAPTLIHSNSTFCWLASFFGNPVRYIPQTDMYKEQDLGKIGDTDLVQKVQPLPHNDALNISIWAKSQRLHTLSYGIPDELIVTEVPEKTQVWADVVPGFSETYSYGPGEEAAYNKMYQRARFAFTWKKGGWDCLRHYEILANGCIPIFRDLKNCPEKTLHAFPKELLQECQKALLPWKDTPENVALYNTYVEKLLEHTRKNLSCSALANRFLTSMGLGPQSKILLIRCDKGVNYFREMLFIGLHRNSYTVSYPMIPYMYEDFSVFDAANMHGFGYAYTKRLKKLRAYESFDNEQDHEREIRNSITNNIWDCIIYAKTGPDEGFEGTAPNLPLWDLVLKNYGREQIAFLYGGDEQFRQNDFGSRYTKHLQQHMGYGHCFVRELN